MSLWSYLLLGLATSLHCVAMCGSLVLTYSVTGGGVEPTVFGRLKPHLVYLGAKTLSYMAVALVLGAIASIAGAALDIEGIRNWIMVVAGVYMVLLGLGMTPWFPWLRHLSPRAPRFVTDLIAKNRRKAVAEKGEGHVSLATPLVFGLLTGLMPCAPLIAAQVGAMGAPSAFQGAALMFAFGLGTAPVMLAFGVAATFVSGKLRQRLQYVAALAVVLFGLVILNRGLMLVGSPVTFDTVRESVIGAAPTTTSAAKPVSGVTEVALVIENTRFVPDVVTVPADTPVRFVVDRREDNACSDQIAVPQVGVLADLKPFATTVVEIPALKAGTYTLTCGMGMMSGKIVSGDAAAAPVWPRYAAIAALVALAGLAGWAVWRRRDSVAPACEAGPAAGAVAGSVAGRPRRIFGLTVVELVVVIVAIAVAVLAGLLLGGGRL